MNFALETHLKKLGLKVFKRLDGFRRVGILNMSAVVTEQKIYFNVIGGKLVQAGGQRFFESINPSTGEAWAKVTDATLADMRVAIQAARVAFDQGPWPQMSVAERAIYLKKLAKLIRDNAKELADIECADSGKTIKQTTFIDVPTCADTFDYYGNQADALAASQIHIPAPVKSELRFDPVGVVAGIIPWNYPLIMAAWKMAPALLAGNTIVFKPSSTASVSVLRLGELMLQAGFPEGVVNIVASSEHAVGEELAKSESVDMLSFTGGTQTGKHLGRLAAGTVKKMTMELGGKSPNIVFADADWDAAVGGTLSAIFMNQGQMCTAGSRLLVEDKIYDRFVEALIQRTQALKIGEAHRYDTDFGPLVSAKQREQVLAFIEQGKAQGARVVAGGRPAVVESGAQGFFLEPTILVEVHNDMPIAREEIFGPVLCVLKFSSETEAIKIANDSPFGLAACVWTKDLAKADQVAGQLRCGTVWINTYGGFYNEAPYGGYKQSGFGRELGWEGLKEYTQIKHVCRDATPGGKPLVTAWFS